MVKRIWTMIILKWNINYNYIYIIIINKKYIISLVVANRYIYIYIFIISIVRHFMFLNLYLSCKVGMKLLRKHVHVIFEDKKFCPHSQSIVAYLGIIFFTRPRSLPTLTVINLTKLFSNFFFFKKK